MMHPGDAILLEIRFTEDELQEMETFLTKTFAR